MEIMIVVGIIGLLATMAIPSYQNSRKKTQMTVCISNLHHIEGAVQQWALEMKKDAGEPVTYDDIRGYLRNTVACPSGGTSFEDSYRVTVVDELPSCVRQPGTHRLP